MNKKTTKKLLTNNGISLIEIIAVVAIGMLLVVVITSPLKEFRNRQILVSATEQVSAVLNEARSNTLVSKDKSSYGVHIESDKVILFTGTIYTESDIGNKETFLNENVSITSNPATDILFQRLTGKTDQNGNIELSLTSSNGTIQGIITIEETGLITISQ